MSRVQLSAVTGETTKVDVIVTLVARGELSRSHLVDASQPDLFGEIDLELVGDLDTEIETEF